MVLADDQEMVRIGFAMILGAASGIDVVGQAADGIELSNSLRGPGPMSRSSTSACRGSTVSRSAVESPRPERER